ncbi:MAG: transporter substrate-binding domain-containing protein [Methanoregula sp.]
MRKAIPSSRRERARGFPGKDVLVPVRGNNRDLRCLKRVFLVLIIVSLIFGICCPAAATRDVRVALTELKPSLFTDDQGKPAGFFVDIIRDIAAREDWNVIWVSGSLSESWGRLANGEIDLLPGVAATPEREKSYNFSREPALSVWSQVYARPGSGINTILDLEGKRVASVKGAISGTGFLNYARKFNVNVTQIDKDTPAEIFSATAAGTADALVVFNTAGQEDAKTYGLSATPVMFDPTPLSFAVSKGKNQDLPAILDRYVAEGKNNPSSAYSQAMQKWFGIKAASEIIPPWLVWGLVAVFIIAILFVGMSILLRREVGRKTVALSLQNEELQAAYEQLRANEKELRENFQELKKSEKALMQARKKLNMLNRLTFQDVQTKLFSIRGYLELARIAGHENETARCLKKGEDLLSSVGNSFEFAKKYQDLGISPPKWQNVNYVLLNAISHLDLSQIFRSVSLDNLEIFADPHLEDVFFTLMENVVHAGSTEIRIHYRPEGEQLIILIEDNGPGIPSGEKERIFEREYPGKARTNLFLAREILSVTDINIREIGKEGAGSRFEISVPEGEYRFGNSGE